jgi:hypothetical protein
MGRHLLAANLGGEFVETVTIEAREDASPGIAAVFNPAIGRFFLALPWSAALAELRRHTVGGTTATSAGTVWIPGSRQSKAAGVPDTVTSAKTYLAAILGEEANDDLSAGVSNCKV